jgi:anti-sigma regulatory factor (Ser/Thr protein kinase)
MKPLHRGFDGANPGYQIGRDVALLLFRLLPRLAPRSDRSGPDFHSGVRLPVLNMNASAIDRVQQTFAAVPASARAARQFVRDTLRSHGAANNVITDYALAVSELATNIIEHGDGSDLIIFLDVADPQWWGMEVVGGATTATNHVLVLEPASWTVAAADEPSGRGLGIVRHLMDDIATDTTDGQLSIRCRRRRVDPS